MGGFLLLTGRKSRLIWDQSHYVEKIFFLLLFTSGCDIKPDSIRAKQKERKEFLFFWAKR